MSFPKTNLHKPANIFYLIKNISNSQIIFCIWVIAFITLFLTACWSGFKYMFDEEEINHVQRAFFISSGYKPYIAFHFMTTPVFQWFIIPVFWFFSYTVQTLEIMRLFMVLLFISKLYVIYLLVKNLFGKNTAYVFVTLLLFDPFTVFSGMQILPDTLMHFLTGLAYLFLLRYFQKNDFRTLFLSGIIFSLSLLVHLRQFPTIVMTIVIFLYFSLISKKIKSISIFLLGLLIPVSALVLFMAVSGSLYEMVQQTIIQPTQLMDKIFVSARLGYFYHADNYNLFGSYGKPINWIYLWLLPSIGFAGAYISAIYINSGKNYPISEREKPIVLSLVLSLIAQWLFLFPQNSLYIKHYLPLSWLYAIFAAYLIVRYYRLTVNHRFLNSASLVVAVVFLIALTQVTVLANLARSRQSKREIFNRYHELWNIVPIDQPVFPTLLFRPPSHPLGVEKFYPELPEYLKNLYLSPPSALEKSKTQYIILTYKEIEAMDSYFKNYLKSKYRKIPNIDGLYIRTP